MADAGNKWYVLKAVSGKEAKVKEYIEAEMKHNDLLAANVSQVLIPVEKHATVRNGKRVVKEKVSLPGYVFVEAKLKGDVAHTLRFLPNVLGFLGGLDEPTPVPQRDINRMLGSAEETEFEENLDCPYLVNNNHLNLALEALTTECACLLCIQSCNIYKIEMRKLLQLLSKFSDNSIFNFFLHFTKLLELFN
jgi:transcription termination/antitermination protein NusG